VAHLILLVGPAKRWQRLGASCLAWPPFELRVLTDFVAALAFLRQHPPAAVVLGLECAGEEALGWCRQFRAAGDFPLLVLCPKPPPGTAVQLLEAGADDVIAEEVSPRELRARLRAHLRRAKQYAQAQQPLLRVGPLEIDRDHRQLRVGQASVDLTPKELVLLEYLVARANRVVRREELLREVWELPPGLHSRTLDVHIARLRQKLAAAAAPVEIATLAGTGYKLTWREPS
jgi:DNA-binding response OmpR family regulator